MNTPISYIPKAIVCAQSHFDDLLKIDWVDLTPARKEYYCNDNPVPYVYGSGRGARIYYPQPYPQSVIEIRKAVETMAKPYWGRVNLDVCFLNRYDTQHHALGWHADNSPEMDDLRPIAIVSLGAEREIWFRENSPVGLRGVTDDMAMIDDGPNGPQPSIEKLKLGNGSLCFMKPGMQDTHQHRIPKGDRKMGARISLTFRGYVP